VGRIAPEKRPDWAVEVARRSGLSLKVGAKVDPVDQQYWEEEIEPLFNANGVEFLGEVNEQETAVLLIRPEATPLAIGPGAALRRQLLPLDGTPTTAALLAPTTALASRLGASVDLLYVGDAGAPPLDEPGSIGAPQYVDQPQHQWPQWANEVITRLGEACAQLPPNVPVRTFLTHGDVGEAIARFAAEHKSDAVILVRRSRLEPGRAGVLRTVLDQTPCPVLLVGD
jgi:nucleotide-binding universal stress UspA family protein